jgi:23S rRNA (uracil1939-C5)-methyltransferase
MDFANKDDKLVNSVAVDAYCGVGTIGLYLAKTARHVVGIEVLSEAIDNAKANARSSDLYNKTSWYVGKSEEVLHNLYMDGLRPGLIVLDPPRSGLEEQLIHSIGARQTPRVIYVSCNPATLGRDLKRFEAFGYKTKEIQPVDMFPQTHHLESVAWLEFDPATSPSPVM